MARRHRRHAAAFARKGVPAGMSRAAAPRRKPCPIVFECTDRKALLLGTALASLTLAGLVAAPVTARAQVTCAGDAGTGPAPISHTGETQPIVCVNNEARTGVNVPAIDLSTTGDDNTIFLDSEGRLQSSVSDAFGIRTATDGARSTITIDSRGDIDPVTTVGDSQPAYGISATTLDSDSPIDINNSGDMWVETTGFDTLAVGINAETGEFSLPTPTAPLTSITAVTCR